MNQFQLEKRNALTKADKSHETKWDERILDLCNQINKTQNFYTTSSCSGRITIIPSSTKKLHNAFLFKSHNKITLAQILPIIKMANSGEALPTTNNQQPITVWFRQEPCALHIACRNQTDAQTLLNKARNLGWKKSGIISSNKRYIIELFSTEIIITPLSKDLPESYLQLLVSQANKKLDLTWTKIEKLKEVI